MSKEVYQKTTFFKILHEIDLECLLYQKQSQRFSSVIYLKFIFRISSGGFLPSLQLFCDLFKITVKTRPGITSEIDPKVYPSDFFELLVWVLLR